MFKGMSEDEVKRKLYGEFSEKVKEDKKDKIEPIPKEKPISIKPARRIFSVKSMIILSVVFMAILGIFIIALVRSSSTTGGEAEEIRGYLVQGKRYYKDGLFDEAILTWKNILNTSPNHKRALRYIKRAELKKKELKIREEENASRLKEMLAKREKEEKEKLLQKKQKEIRIEIKRLLKEGDQYFRKGDLSRALAAYEKVLVLSHRNYYAVKRINRIEMKLAKEKKAEVPKKEKEISEKVTPAKENGPFYNVQIATYADIKHAQDLVKKLSNQGYKKVRVKEIESRGKAWYCVYMGAFMDKKEATIEMERIKKEGFKDSFIKTEK